MRRLDPRRGAGRHPLLVERLALEPLARRDPGALDDPARPALQGRGPLAQGAQDSVAARQVVLDHLQLGDPDGREVRLARVAHPHRVPVDLQGHRLAVLARLGHGPTLAAIPCLPTGRTLGACGFASSAPSPCSARPPPDARPSTRPITPRVRLLLDAGAHSASGAHASPSPPAPPQPLRAGEAFVTVGVADDLPGGEYEPAAPKGGTDDYRCFLADPGLTADSFITGVAFLPGNPAAGPPLHPVPGGARPDQRRPGQGRRRTPGPVGSASGAPASPLRPRTRSTGSMPPRGSPVGAWRPRERVRRGVRRSGLAGSRIVVQMHYNLDGAE